MDRLIVSSSPHIRSARTTQKIMLDVIIALLPALVASAIIFGPRTLLLAGVSAAACVACEAAWEKFRKQPCTVSDLSAVVTGLLIAFNVPSGMPVWELVIGDMVAILIVKMLFGGLGCNFINPAMVGRTVLFLSFTADMTNYTIPKGAVDALSSATPLAVMGELSWSDFPELLLGVHGGVMGETCALALIAGGIYLVIRRVIKPIIPISYICSTLLFSWIFGGEQPVLSLFAGGLMLGAIFMATDYVTSPYTNKGKLIFGIGCGLLTAAIRIFSNSAGGVSFSILLMNLLVPYINGITMPKPLGGVSEK